MTFDEWWRGQDTRFRAAMMKEDMREVWEAALQTQAAEVAELTKQRDALIVAAQAVIDHWDAPLSNCEPPTGEFINRLRVAIDNTKGEA